MKHFSIKLLSVAMLALAGWTAADACTNLLVGKNASADEIGRASCRERVFKRV